MAILVAALPIACSFVAMPSLVRSVVFDDRAVVAFAEGAHASVAIDLPSNTSRLEIELATWPVGDHVLLFSGLPLRLAFDLDNALWPETLRISKVGLTVEAANGCVVHHQSFASPLANDLHVVPLRCMGIAWNSGGNIVASSCFEVRFLPSAELIGRFQELAASTQASGDVGLLLSIARFFDGLLPWREFFRERSVVVSGCGTGGELIALDLLGAESVCGVEMEGIELELASTVAAAVPGISTVKYLPGLPGVHMCDVVMSRHVIEHVPQALRNGYLAEIAMVIKPGGYLLLEAPNQLCPIEPHTGIRFFHWLSEVQQDSAIAYFEEKAKWGETFGRELHLLKTLRGHSNGSLVEIEELSSPFFELIETRSFDTTFVISDGASRSGDVIQAVLRRKSDGAEHA
jgi:SAM-dependent methyltransferase